MRKLALLILFLGMLAGAYALTVNLVITNTAGSTLTFQCQPVGFVPETYDWDVGDGPDRLVLYDVTNSTVTYTFDPGELGRASCTAWDAQTNQVAVHEIYFNVNHTNTTPNATLPDLHDVSFRGCSEVWIVFDSFEPGDQVAAIIKTSEGDKSVIIEYDDLTKIPGQYGQLPLYKYDVHANVGADAKILGVVIGGQTFTNTNNCASAPHGNQLEVKKAKN